ncbi:MAG: PD-(D/E)XK nuclease family protein, partial [Parcubacteria group bacterium]|nr:PD-(D/E)XK nuclease family protein [Parcubacteria group bacterium]
IEKLKKKISAAIEAIRASSFPATPAKEKCRHCDFKNICEFRIL